MDPGFYQDRTGRLDGLLTVLEDREIRHVRNRVTRPRHRCRHKRPVGQELGQLGSMT